MALGNSFKQTGLCYYEPCLPLIVVCGCLLFDAIYTPIEKEIYLSDHMGGLHLKTDPRGSNQDTKNTNLTDQNQWVKGTDRPGTQTNLNVERTEKSADAK